MKKFIFALMAVGALVLGQAVAEEKADSKLTTYIVNMTGVT